MREQAGNTFTKSRAGLVAAILSLALGAAGILYNVSIGSYEAIIPFLLVISLGAFLTTMQFTGTRR